MRKIFTIAFILTVACMAARDWQHDILAGFRQTTISLHGSDRPVCTVVNMDTPSMSHRAVLYIHGYNDYFFQEEMAREWVAHGYNFFAVDLRRYGRSLREGQKQFDTRNLDEYNEDIDSALSVIKECGNSEVVMMGHSTGGLISCNYLLENHPADVKALILNSPFLDWNLGKMEKFTGAVAFIGKIFPRLEIPQGHSRTYAESLMKSGHGEWEYDTIWKSPTSRPVTAGWVKAIDNAQKKLRRADHPIKVPVLLLMSAKSIDSGEWVPEANEADAVLSVDDIARYGRNLSESTTAYKFTGGLHDLALSAPKVRRKFYYTIFSWLQTTMPRQ